MISGALPSSPTPAWGQRWRMRAGVEGYWSWSTSSGMPASWCRAFRCCLSWERVPSSSASCNHPFDNLSPERALARIRIASLPSRHPNHNSMALVFGSRSGVVRQFGRMCIRMVRFCRFADALRMLG